MDGTGGISWIKIWIRTELDGTGGISWIKVWIRTEWMERVEYHQSRYK